MGRDRIVNIPNVLKVGCLNHPQLGGLYTFDIWHETLNQYSWMLLVVVQFVLFLPCYILEGHKFRFFSMSHFHPTNGELATKITPLHMTSPLPSMIPWCFGHRILPLHSWGRCTPFRRVGKCHHFAQTLVVFSHNKKRLKAPGVCQVTFKSFKLWYEYITVTIRKHICIHTYVWVSYNISLTWIKAIWGWFPLLTMIPSEVAVRSQWGRSGVAVRSQWGRSEVVIIYPDTSIYSPVMSRSKAIRTTRICAIISHISSTS